MKDEIERIDFPPAARHFLDCLYAAKGANTNREKSDSLRTCYELKHAWITGDDDELRILEFYALTKQGLI